MGSLENHGEATAGPRSAAEGSYNPNRAKFCGTWKTLVGFLPMQRPSRKPKTIGKATAPSTAFSPRFRGARPHTPLAPLGARAAQPRGNPIARGGAMGRGAKGKNRLPVEKKTRPNGAPTARRGLGQPPPRAPRTESPRRAPERTSAHRRPSQVRLTLGPSTFNLFSTPTTTFNNHA